MYSPLAVVVAVSCSARAAEGESRNHKVNEDVVVDKAARSSALADWTERPKSATLVELICRKRLTVLRILVVLRKHVEGERGLALLDEANHGVLVRQRDDGEDRAKDLLCGEPAATSGQLCRGGLRITYCTATHPT